MSPEGGTLERQVYSGRVKLVHPGSAPSVIITKVDGLELYGNVLRGYAAHLDSQSKGKPNGPVNPRNGWLYDFCAHWGSDERERPLNLKRRDFVFGRPDFDVTIDARRRNISIVVPEDAPHNPHAINGKIILRRNYGYQVPNGDH